MSALIADLGRIRDDIQHDLERRNNATDEWVEATLSLCRNLAAARAQFADNQSFGRWFKECGFSLGKNDRSAAISMGNEPERAREVLMVTERRSLQLIHEEEFRLPSARNTPKIEQNQSTSKSSESAAMKKKPMAESVQRALGAYDAIKAAGDEPTPKAVREKAGVGGTAERKAFAMRQAEERARADVESENTSLEHFVRIYIEKLEEILGIMSWPRFNVMTHAEFNKLRAALHPDTFETRTLEQVTEAFHLIEKYKIKMVSDEPERKLSSSLPRTREQMLALRKTTQRGS